MVRLRSRIAWIAAAWLVCQSFALAVPIAASVIAETTDICTCPGGVAGAQCPMHHHGLGMGTEKPPAPAVRNACAQPDATLLSLAGGIGVLPQPADISADSTTSPVELITSTPLHRSEIPDAPPPRA